MTIAIALRNLNNSVLDLQAADYNTFERPLERMAQALNSDALEAITNDLKSKADFEKFLQNASAGGSMMGSARLNWPANHEEEMGLVIHLIERAAKEPHWFNSLAHTYYYSGSKFIAGIRKITTSVIIPFNRDFTSYIADKTPAITSNEQSSPPSSSVTYHIGSMTNSPLQHISSGATGNQVSNYSTDQLEAIVSLYRERVDELRLDEAQRRRADAQIATIEAQLLDEPDPTIIKAAGRTLRTIIEGALGGAAGTALAAAPLWTPLISMFS